MPISEGSPFPHVQFNTMEADGPHLIDSQSLASGGSFVLFGVPGAFTPTCSAAHLPGFVRHAEAIRAKNIDQIACMSVNDVFVMDAWGKAHSAEGKVKMLADENCEAAKALGMEQNLGRMGLRSKRFALVVREGRVVHVGLDESGALDVSSAESILKVL